MAKYFKSIFILFGAVVIITFTTSAYFSSSTKINENEFATGIWTPVPILSPTPSETPFEKITICHNTGAEGNPYTEITISEQGVLNGHLDHPGDIIPAPTEGCPTSILE